MCDYRTKSKRTDLNASEVKKAELLSRRDVKACLVFAHCQSTEHGPAQEQRQGAKRIWEDHKSSEVHRKVLCMPQCINNIPFVRGNQVLAKTGNDSGSTDKNRVSEKVNKTTPAHFKFKRNTIKIKHIIWQPVSPLPQFNSDCAPLVFRDSFSKVQRPSKTASSELQPSDSSRITSPLRKLLSIEQKHPLRNFQNGNQNISLRIFFLYSWSGNLMCTFFLELSPPGESLSGCWPCRRSQSSQGGWLTSEGNAGKSDLVCILNRSWIRTQEAATSELREQIRLFSCHPKSASDCALRRGLHRGWALKTRGSAGAVGSWQRRR